MSEHISPIPFQVPTHKLFRAVVQLDGKKHPAKVQAISEELQRRDLPLERKAA